jgi:hypothetical protein
VRFDLRDAHGRCLPRTSLPGCGGAIPEGNVCVYDQCATDADCKAAMPAGAAIATCPPSGALGRVEANLRVRGLPHERRLTKNPGGVCLYDLGPTHGQCVLGANVARGRPYTVSAFKRSA